MTQNRDNSGALFQNMNRRGQSSPHYTGRIRINGADYFVSAWKKIAGQNTKRPGQTYLSMSATPQSEMDGGWNNYQQTPPGPIGQYGPPQPPYQQTPQPQQQYNQQPSPPIQPYQNNQYQNTYPQPPVDDIPF